MVKHRAPPPSGFSFFESMGLGTRACMSASTIPSYTRPREVMRALYPSRLFGIVKCRALEDGHSFSSRLLIDPSSHMPALSCLPAQINPRHLTHPPCGRLRTLLSRWSGTSHSRMVYSSIGMKSRCGNCPTKPFQVAQQTELRKGFPSTDAAQR